MKRILSILITLVIVVLSVNAQKQKVRFQPYADQKLYRFGITVGMSFQDIIMTNSGVVDEATGEIWYATIPNYAPGFTVGLSADLYLNPYMNLRFTPTINFGDKNFEMVEENTDERFKTSVRSNYLNLPLDIKFRASRVNNYRPYVIAGAYVAMDFGRNKDEPLLLRPIDYGITIGIGCDLYFPLIKVAPELRFSFGFADIFDHERKDLTDASMRKYSNAISKGTTRMISLVFNFE